MHAHAALLRLVGELDEVAERAVARVDVVVVADVVAVVAARRRLERHQPQAVTPRPAQVVEAAHQPLEVADAVAVGVHEGADGQAVDDGVLVPEVVDHERVQRKGWRARGRAQRRWPAQRVSAKTAPSASVPPNSAPAFERSQKVVLDVLAM